MNRELEPSLLASYCAMMSLAFGQAETPRSDPIAPPPGPNAVSSHPISPLDPITLRIYDVRDLLQPEVELARRSFLGAVRDEQLSDELAKGFASGSSCLVEHLERRAEREIGDFEASKAIRLVGSSALVVRGTPVIHDYVEAVLTRARRLVADPQAMPLLMGFPFEIRGDGVAKAGFSDASVEIVTDGERCRGLAALFQGEAGRAKAEELGIRKSNSSFDSTLAAFMDTEVPAGNERRFVTGYDAVNGVWPDDRVVYVPRIESVASGGLRLSAIPLPGEAFEIALRFEIAEVVEVKEGVAEGGPIATPVVDRFQFDSRVIMEPGNWVLATLDPGEPRKMVAIWLTPVVNGVATTEYPK